MYAVGVNDPASEFLNVRETARRLAVHENTVRAYAKRGLLPDARVPGTSFYRFRVSEVERLKAQRGAPAVSLAAERRTASPEYATASQLALWPETNAREAQDRLPELVRRLLFETPGAGQISIRTGDGVALAGKDGVATLEGQTHLLPAGQIWFEFGTDKDSKRKATKDYVGRKSEASQDVTFVFVTVRRWQGKDSWADERRAEKFFKDVFVLDADDLEAWLQVAPAAHLWISETLGLRPRDALTLETWWERFSAATAPALPLNLFVAGRAKETQVLQTLLNSEPKVISIQTEWTEDALGFLQACLTQMDSKLNVLNDVTIVRSADVWNRIVDFPGRGILVPDFDNADVARATASGRNVVSIIDSDSATRRSVDILLPRVGRNEAAEAFRADDVDWSHADRLAVLARRSMPALARKLSRSPRVQKPLWSKPPLATSLTALMLASRWSNQSDDLQVLSELSAVSLDDLQRAIDDASQGSDPAIRSVRGVCVFTSLEEAFLAFGNRVSLKMAYRWAKIATNVLLDNPHTSLNAHEQITAQMNGLQRTYSSALRKGIAESLALAGAFDPGPDDTNFADSAAERAVREVLHQVTAGSEEHTWGTVADMLPLLAEAAPNTFLTMLEDDLATSNPTVGQMFQIPDETFILGPSGHHHHLLWALEVLCWSPDHLVRAIQILTQLCRYDLPENSRNNPLESMSAVLCGWSRNTGADLEIRLQALDACRVVNEGIGWELLKALLLDSKDGITPPHEPRYQLWKPPSGQMLHSEWLAFVTRLVNRLLEWVKSDWTYLPCLVEAISKVGLDEGTRIIEFLEDEALIGGLDGDIRLLLFEQVRDTVARHAAFPNSKWAMSAEQRTRLHNLGELLQPVDDLRTLTYLFKWRPFLSDVDMNDHESYRTALETKRREAFNILFDRSDAWEQLGAIAVRAEVPSQLGWALSIYMPVDALDNMLKWLASDSTVLQEAAITWVRNYLFNTGPAGLKRVLERDDVGSESLTRLVLNIPIESRFWKVLVEFPTAEDTFWSKAPFTTVPNKDLTRAIEMLLERGRSWSAIAVASYGVSNHPEVQNEHLPSTTLILSILRAALTEDPGRMKISQMNVHHVGNLLDYLVVADVPIADLASLEFGYFGILQHDREPWALNQALSSDPALFVDLVQRTYRGASDTTRQSKSADALTKQAWWVLHDWHGFPGQQEDGTLDQAAMDEWFIQARQQLSHLDRADIGDELIGGTFAYAPADVDGIWPPVPVRNLIESTRNRNLEKGIAIGRINSRGITSRGIYDGGDQERTLASQYKQWSQEVQSRWPRTARVLRNIAEYYKRDAAREDGQAQLDQDLD